MELEEKEVIRMAERIGKLLRTYERKEGAVKDLAEKVKSGETTPKQAKEESKKRGFTPDKLSFTPVGILFSVFGIIGFFLCIAPTVYKYLKIEVLNFSTRFQPIEIPLIVIGIVIGIAIAFTILIGSATPVRKKTGGCGSEDFTVILVKDGPYRIIRHPTHFKTLTWIIAIVIAVSPWISFTVLSILGILMIILAFYLMEIQEEKFDQVKFGDEYRQYMKEVPRWNIIKGLWNLRRGG